MRKGVDMRVLGIFLLGVLVVTVPIGCALLAAHLDIRPPWAYVLIGVVPLMLALAYANSLVGVLSGRSGPVRKVLAACVVMLLAVGLVGGLQVLGMAVYAMSGRPSVAQQKAFCLSKVKNLTLAVLDYADEHEGRLPAAETWCDDLLPYIRGEEAFLCPAAPDLQCAYAFNAALSGVRAESIPDLVNVVLIFESDGGWNAAGGMELLAEEPRHLGGENYGFVDGHAAWIGRRLADADEEGERVYERVPAKDGIRWDVPLPAE